MDEFAAGRGRGWDAGDEVRKPSGGAGDSREDWELESHSGDVRIRGYYALWSGSVFIPGEQFRCAYRGDQTFPGSDWDGAAGVTGRAGRFVDLCRIPVTNSSPVFF